MRIVRTFHPVGQGAFYTEKLYDDNNVVKHIMVFDCGVAWGRVSKAKHLVKHAFDSSEVVDYLVISHLDYDHISLASTLFESVYQVRHIVLPLVSEEDLIIALALHRIAGHATCCSFIEKIVSHLRHDYNDDFQRGDYSLIFVGQGQTSDWTHTLWPDGEPRSLDLRDSVDWVFIPYNVESVSRKAALVNELDSLLKDADICNELEDLGRSFSNSNLFFDALKDSSFVKNVIEKRGAILKGLKKVYDSIGGTINENSLQLYSGPSEIIHRLSEEDYDEWRYRAACLYTGDCLFDLATWRDIKYCKVWGNVGTIQLPHHGSIESFDIAKNPIDRYYTFVVSCGNDNTFGHPSMRLLEYLLLSGCDYRIVNESIDSVFMSQITILEASDIKNRVNTKDVFAL